jgi:hypothetical protein
MVKKDFNLSPSTIAQLKIAKDGLEKRTNKSLPWEDVFSEVLKGFNSLNSKSTNSPSQANIPTPVLPQSPTLAKKGLPKMEINIPMPNAGKKMAAPALNTSDPLADDTDLGIPTVPRKKAITISADAMKLDELAKRETADTKFILIECSICGAQPIVMPVPKKMVLEASEPVVDVSYCHGEKKHVIVAQLDHDFQVRRQRASWIVFEENFK